MGKASRDGGLYYNAQGIAVDAEGKAVKDAPKRSSNTVIVADSAAVSTNALIQELAKAIRTPAEVARQPDRK